MTSIGGADLGAEASRRLAQFGNVNLEPGLTEPEFIRIEERFEFEFSDDHKAFLSAGLPVSEPDLDVPEKASWGWPNWRELESRDLHSQVEWPYRMIMNAVEFGDWPESWGRAPRDPERRIDRARQLLGTVPRLIPIYAHRYLPGGRNSSGQPVFSLHRLSDIVIFGHNLAHYIDEEFGQANVCTPFWKDYARD